MHKLVVELEHRGLLTLQPRAGHGRIRDAHLTEVGRALLTQADARAHAVEDRMTAGLDQQQVQQLMDLLQRCVTALDTPPTGQQHR
jgi:DNA-binding MarR family transcriptional regulator